MHAAGLTWACTGRLIAGPLECLPDDSTQPLCPQSTALQAGNVMLTRDLNAKLGDVSGCCWL